MGQKVVKKRTSGIRRCPVVTIDAGGHRERVLERRDQLVADHLDMVDSIARSVMESLPPSFELDDLVAAGRLELIRSATRYRPQTHGGTPFEAYARICVRGAIVDCCRRRDYDENTRPPLDGLPEPSAEPAREISIDRGRLWRRVASAIEQLPPDQRKVMNAYYGPDEPSFVTLAPRLHMPPTRAKMLHAAAIDNLRDILRAV